MEELLAQIELGLAHNLYYLSLYVALTIPDICGALGSSDGRATAKRYIKWFDDHVAPQYLGRIAGEDCWDFRCSLLHQGSSQIPKYRHSRVLFIEPIDGYPIVHNGILQIGQDGSLLKALSIDVRVFCLDVIDGARKWLEKHRNIPNYQKNMKLFMQRHPQGIAPFIVGLPVIG